MQRNKKRSIIFELHSIPIKFRKQSKHRSLCERLYLVSYSIPLSCMIVLLLGFSMMINPGLFLTDTSSAITIQDEWIVKGSDESAKREPAEPDAQNTNTANNTDGSDSGIMPMAENPDGEDTESSIALTVANTDQVIQAAQGGSTVYGSYGIGISGTGITAYTLNIKADSVNLTPPSGNSSIISGAENKTGNNMSTDTWGYALTDTSTTISNYANLTYKSLPVVDTAILSEEGIMAWRFGVDKDLVFAAKFSENVSPGNYSGHITLNVVATPRVTTAKWSNGVDSLITDMQEVASGFCQANAKVPTGSTITLKDNRGSSPVSYKIVKLKDDKCWMQENLRLPGGTKLTKNDSDVNSDWTLPPSATSWDTSNYQAVQMKNGASGMTVNSGNAGDGKGWQSNYGNYYSWCAATAESCKTNRTGNPITSGTAAESICPKNWHLPTGNTNGEFYNVLNGLNFTTVQQDPYKFPAAGRVYTNAQLYNPGTYGYYWSSTPDSNGNYAYALYFYSSNFAPGTSNLARFYGFSVRCVADY